MIWVGDDAMEILARGEDEQQKPIDSYNNYDLKSPSSASAASTSDLSSASSSDDSSKASAKETAPDKVDDEVWLRNGRDATENHGTFISNDDDYLNEKPVLAKNGKNHAHMMEAQREILAEDDDGNIHGEFTGHEGATSEVYEDYKESIFAVEEVQYEQEWSDYSYDNTSMY